MPSALAFASLGLALALAPAASEAGLLSACGACGTAFGVPANYAGEAIPCLALQQAINELMECAAGVDAPCVAAVTNGCTDSIVSLNANYSCGATVPVQCSVQALRPIGEYDNGTCTFGPDSVLNIVVSENATRDCLAPLVELPNGAENDAVYDIFDDPTNQTCANLNALHLGMISCLQTIYPSCAAGYMDGACAAGIETLFQAECPTFSCALTAAPSAAPTPKPTSAANGLMASGALAAVAIMASCL